MRLHVTRFSWLIRRFSVEASTASNDLVPQEGALALFAEA